MTNKNKQTNKQTNKRPRYSARRVSVCGLSEGQGAQEKDNANARPGAKKP